MAISSSVGTYNYSLRLFKLEDELLQDESACMGHDRSKERVMFERPFRESIKACEVLREQGNVYYKEGDFDKASCCYQKALVQLDYCFAGDDSELAVYDGMRFAVVLNLALACFKLGNYRRSLGYCNDAISLNPGNFKAILRRILCLIELGEYEAALKDISKAMGEGTGDSSSDTRTSELESLQKVIKIKLSKAKNGENAFWRAAFWR